MIDNTPITLISTAPEFFKLVEQINKADLIAIDTETTSLDPHTTRLLLMQLWFNNKAYVLDMTRLNHKYLSYLKPALEDPTKVKIGHNLAFDYKILYKFGKISLNGLHDTMVCDKLIYAGLMYDHDLKSVVLRELGITLEKETRNTFLELRDQTDIVWSPQQLRYAALDVIIPPLLYHKQIQQLDQYKLKDKIYPLEMAIIPPAAIMEYTGIFVERSMLEEMVKPFQKFVEKADQALQDLLIANGAADEITFTRDGYFAVNTNSGDQMKAALAKVGVEPKDTQGKVSLNSKVVQRWDMQQRRKKRKKSDIDYSDFEYADWVQDDEVADALEQYKVLDNPFLRAHAFLQGARKLYSTYIVGIQAAINSLTNRVHPGFSTMGAERTGRFSSQGPNFQNIPNDKRLHDLGLHYSIRKCIKAAKGRKLIIADYAGIELVILAVMSGDKKLMQQIFTGDVHTMVAREVLGFLEINKSNKKEEPFKTMRDGAKTLSYAIAYGTTGRNIAETLNIKLASLGYKITPQEGDELINKWYGLFPDTERYLKGNADNAIMYGFVTDTWGRRRHWDRTTFTQKFKKLAAMREGMNMPIQGTSATMTKRAIQLIWGRLDPKKARMVITVHDEIVTESIDSYVEEACTIIKECMQQAIAETLPDVADEVGMHEGTSVSPAVSTCYDK